MFSEQRKLIAIDLSEQKNLQNLNATQNQFYYNHLLQKHLNKGCFKQRFFYKTQ